MPRQLSGDNSAVTLEAADYAAWLSEWEHKVNYPFDITGDVNRAMDRFRKSLNQ